MTSFIELPRLSSSAQELPAAYVNVDDIITLVEDYDGQTRLEIRGLGSEGMSAAVTTYAPIHALLLQLRELAEQPGVRTWTTETRRAWAAPIAARLQAGIARERAAR